MTRNEGVIKRVLDFISYMIMAILISPFLRNFDVIVSTSPQFFTAIAGYVISQLKRKPFVFEISDLWPESIKAVGIIKNRFLLRFLERVELFLYKKSKHIVAQTESFKDNLVFRKIDPGKISVILNGANSKKFYPIQKTKSICTRFNIHEDKITIGYIGTHGVSQGLKTILDAAFLLNHDDRIHFSFVGEGASKESLISYMKKKEIKNTRFNFAVCKNEVVHAWAAMDIVLVPLLNKKTFSGVIPSKLFEAMAMGKLIILIAPNGEASNLLSKNKAGVHILPDNPKLLSITILNLISDQSLIEQYKINARNAALKYSREEQAKNMLAVLLNQFPGG
jgi:glycosyltransferase involved in cell wall biosynthesis